MWNKIHLLLFLYVTCIFMLCEAQENVTIKTPLGTLRGFKEHGVQKFYGVPYAQPPVGDLRFQKPKPYPPWNGVKDVLDRVPICYQSLEFVKALFVVDMPDMKMSEDCLYLYIFVPDSVDNAINPLPVMAWIHGGGFMIGEPLGYGTTPGHILAKKGNVIVVMIAYRVDIFGFLPLQHKDTPANVGLFDQHMALKWINQNIAAFGGNPNKVTIFGESAGGMSVGYQTLYDGNKGLFYRAISQSGTVGRTLHDRKENELYFIPILSKNLGCPMLGKDKLVQCLIDSDADSLFSNSTVIPVNLHPSVDRDFIKAQPGNLLETGRYNKVPYLFSTTSGTVISYQNRILIGLMF